MQSAINGMSSNGFVSAGYRFFQVDCGWAASNRDSSGTLTPDTSRFPNGLSGLANSARSKGMYWSMYTDQGFSMCDTRVPSPVPGSLNYETQDVSFFKSLGTAYVKVDNCYADGRTAADNAPKTPRSDFPSRYGRMRDALNSAGINGSLVCQWGVPYSSSTGLQGPAQWTPSISTSFRVADDIAQGWVSVLQISNQAIHINRNGANAAGNRADYDLLEVGNNGMTFAEQQSHFALWAMSKSALMISTDVVSPSDATKSILLNKDLIAINQDDLGKPIVLVQRWSNDRDLYAGPLANGDQAVLLVEQGGNAGSQTIDFASLGISRATVKNLWTGATVTGASSYTANVAAHGSIPLRLSNIVSSNAAAPTLKWYEAESGALSNGANIQNCSGCSGGKKVGYVGTLTINNIYTSATKSNVRIDYINADVQFSFNNQTNTRGGFISVNGGAAKEIYFPLSGYNWDTDVYKNFLVELDGFKTSGPNTISISGGSYLSQYAPDFDRIGVVA